MINKKRIAIIVPTIREDRIEAFKKAWADQIALHDAELVVVHDGDVQCVEWKDKKFTPQEIMGKKYLYLISKKTDACRNLGFAFVEKYMFTDVYISLDDDVLPEGDTIGRHLEALDTNACISWVSTLAGIPVRGMPYGVREEAKVMLSHGVWSGVPDLDAPSQLVKGVPSDFKPTRGPIPKGVYFPLCAMNFAFHRDALPFAYQAPMNTHGLDRFADIWCGIYLKREFDKRGWAVYTGHASVIHDRASNVFKNLQKEAKGLELNEGVYKFEENDEYFKLYKRCREGWVKFLKTL